ncbi:MAG: NAD/NADP octopine/nopaline dehydrogenase family protein [Burkholderiales bacterium]
MRVAVIGHSSLNIAPAVAADLAMRGFEVAWWPAPTEVTARGGLEVREGHLLDAGRNGFAPVRPAGSPAAALAGADAAVIDIPAADLLPQVSAFADALPAGALVHLQSHGYWPASRLGAAMPGRGVVFADSSAPTHAAAYAEGTVTAHARRRGLRFACVGGQAIATLEKLYPGAQAADNALETGLESINLMIHPGATLANLAALDRAATAGAGFAFYGEGNTESAACLAEALDAERAAVCAAWGVRWRSLRDTIGALYGARGNTLREAISDCPFYAGLGALPARAPAGWARTDLPFALAPLVRLAGARSVAVPLHRAVLTVLGTVFDLDPWAYAPTLNDLGVKP